MKCQNCGKQIEDFNVATQNVATQILGSRLCSDCRKIIIRQSYPEPILTTNYEVEYSTVVKSDNGKPRLDLVPLEVLYPLAKVREYGLSKYGKSGMENWDKIEDERYLAALLRHLVAYQKDNNALDEESGLPAIYHVLCNAAFLAIKHARKEQQEDK